MALPSATGRFRQRKISVKQSLDVMRQKDLPDLDTEEQQRELQQIDTGVEKAEEGEKDLQAVMQATQAKVHGGHASQVSIPTPDASKHWTTPAKYYLRKYETPEDYLKFSSTVEDTSGCTYNMDEHDEKWLQDYNKSREGVKRCTEDEFEIIMSNYERVVDKKQPFLAMDPKQILSYEELKKQVLVLDTADPAYVAQSLARELKLPHFRTLLDYPTKVYPRPLKEIVTKFGKDVYSHWKERRLARGGNSVYPTVKFEEPGQKDDSDPYICFRRREYRHARKTRRADIQGVEKLQLLDRDLNHVKEMLLMVTRREMERNDELVLDHEVFVDRRTFKDLKRKLGIPGDEDILIDHRRRRATILRAQRAKEAAAAAAAEKERQRRLRAERERRHHHHRHQQDKDARRREMANVSSAPVPVQPYVKLPGAKVPDLAMTTVNTVLRDKLDGIKKAVSDKLIKRKLQDEGWVNFTDDAYNPYFGLASDDQAVPRERSHIPFSSISTSMQGIDDSRPIDFSYVFNNSKHYSNSDAEILKIDPTTGNLVRNDRHNYMPEFYDLAGQDGVDDSDCGLNVGSREESFYDKNRLGVSAVRFKLRKRVGRNGLSWVDRKRITDNKGYLQYLMDVDEPLVEDEKLQVSDRESVEEEEPKQKKRKVAYDSVSRQRRRLQSRFMFDSDLPMMDPVDPSRLNQIGPQTQDIRFGCMLLSKAYDSMHQIRQKQIEAYQQRLLRQQKMLQQRQKAAQNSGARPGTPKKGARPNGNGMKKAQVA